MAAAKEISADDADDVFTIEEQEEHRKDTARLFSRWTTLLRFNPDWLWREFR